MLFCLKKTFFTMGFCCKRPKNKEEESFKLQTLNKIISKAKWCTLPGFYMDFMILVVLTSINATGLLIGLTVASETFGLAVTGPIVGKIINKRSNISLTMAIGNISKAISIGIIFVGFSFESIPLISFGVFTKGIARTMVRESFRVIIADHTPFKNRSEYLGKLRQQMGIGIAIGCFVGFGWLPVASNPEIPWKPSYLPYQWWFRTIVPMIFFMIGNIYAAFIVPKYIKIIQAINDGDDDINNGDDINGGDTNDGDTNDGGTNENIEITKNDTTESTIVVETDSKDNMVELTERQLKYGFIGLLLLLGTEQLVGSLMRPFVIPFLNEKLSGYSTQVLTLAYTPGGILSIILAPIIGKILDQKIKILPRYTLCIASIVGAGITAAFIFGAQILIAVIFIIIIDFTVLTVAGLSLEKMVSGISKSHRGSIFGAQTFVENIATMLGPIIGGLLWDYVSHTMPFWSSVVVESVIGVSYVIFFCIYPLDTMSKDRV